MKRKPRKLQQSVKSELSVRETSSDTRAADDGSKWHISEDCDVSREENTESSRRYDYDNTCSSLDVKHKPPSMLAVKASTSSASNQSRRNTKDVREACIRFVAVKSVIERNLTIMMFAASIVFILSFLPFFVIRVIMRIYAGNGIDYELKTGIQFALKLPILNSVFNPIIYGVFNSKFRKFLKRGFCRF
ncbi:octopamine receptor-like [Mercenaria mercenaria]|uniref:octopamine receptor-like n=1 Tax=Mercenaria mercenaria TaxID=6596 RepID=UPI001E1E12FC|nr:octopamine receptor-like [Mercenaria mercenaria]